MYYMYYYIYDNQEVGPSISIVIQGSRHVSESQTRP